jgi:hypothetical protein
MGLCSVYKKLGYVTACECVGCKLSVFFSIYFSASE